MWTGNVTGRLGQDPEVKHLQDGTAVVEFSIAVSSQKKDGETTWIRASMFGERATKILETFNFRKGDRFCASGRFENRNWTSREGKPGSTTEMRIDHVDVIHDKRDGADQPAPSNTHPAPAAQPQRNSRVPF